MKDFVKFILEKIVSDKDALAVTEEVQGTNHQIKIKVADSDMGLVIGKGGKTIKSIRALTKAKAIKDGIRVRIELEEPPNTNYQSDDYQEND